jgi:hypothetical protein
MREKKREHEPWCLPLLIRMLTSSWGALLIWPHPNLITSQWPALPNTITLWVRVSTHEFWGDTNIQFHNKCQLWGQRFYPSKSEPDYYLIPTNSLWIWVAEQSFKVLIGGCVTQVQRMQLVQSMFSFCWSWEVVSWELVQVVHSQGLSWDSRLWTWDFEQCWSS